MPADAGAVASSILGSSVRRNLPLCSSSGARACCRCGVRAVCTRHGFDTNAISIARRWRNQAPSTQHFSPSLTPIRPQKNYRARFAIRNARRPRHREIFSVPQTGNAAKISFTFLTDTRVAIADGGTFRASDSQTGRRTTGRSIQAPAGPRVCLIRQDAEGKRARLRGPGVTSPQLSALLNQLL